QAKTNACANTQCHPHRQVTLEETDACVTTHDQWSCAAAKRRWISPMAAASSISLILSSGSFSMAFTRAFISAKVRSKARAITSSEPSTWAGSATPQWALTVSPIHNGQLSPAAASQTVTAISSGTSSYSCHDCELGSPTGTPWRASTASAFSLTLPVGKLPALYACSLPAPRWLASASAMIERQELPVQRNNMRTGSFIVWLHLVGAAVRPRFAPEPALLRVVWCSRRERRSCKKCRVSRPDGRSYGVLLHAASGAAFEFG